MSAGDEDVVSALKQFLPKWKEVADYQFITR
jgi:hypothetical protein